MRFLLISYRHGSIFLRFDGSDNALEILSVGYYISLVHTIPCIRSIYSDDFFRFRFYAVQGISISSFPQFFRFRFHDLLDVSFEFLSEIIRRIDFSVLCHFPLLRSRTLNCFVF